MDTITQMALGAVIGQAIGHKKLGPKTAIYGALGGLIPDLDVLYDDLLGPYGTWQYHRHITHSIFFAPVVAPLLGWLTWAAHKKQPGQYHLFAWIWFWAVLTHPLLDTLTIYGTQLLAPFSNHRFAVPAVSIIDPAYTLPLFAALFLPAIPWMRARAHTVAMIALAISTLYLGYSGAQNIIAERLAAMQLAQQNITAQKLSVYTTIFQPWLRRVVVREQAGGHEWLRVGFVSTWNPQPITWVCLQQNGERYRDEILQTEGGRVFNWFAMGELSYVREGDTVTIMDARYGTPGPSVFGFWGLGFTLERGIIAVEKEPAYIRAPREVTGDAIRGLYRAAFGLPNDFLPAQNRGCP